MSVPTVTFPRRAPRREASPTRDAVTRVLPASQTDDALVPTIIPRGTPGRLVHQPAVRRPHPTMPRGRAFTSTHGLVALAVHGLLVLVLVWRPTPSPASQTALHMQGGHASAGHIGERIQYVAVQPRAPQAPSRSVQVRRVTPPPVHPPVHASVPHVRPARAPAMHAPTPVTSTARARVPAITRPVAASSASPRVPPAATGGEGTDVLHIDSRGDAFPFPAYLKNVVRQIGMRFQPGGAIRGVADVHFLIQRDGHISELRVVQSTGGYALNTEAMGAIESAGNAGAFGPLPSGWKDDVLEVTFHFAPVAR